MKNRFGKQHRKRHVQIAMEVRLYHQAADPKCLQGLFAMFAKLRTLRNIIFHLATAWSDSFRFGGFLRHSVESEKR